MGQDMYAYCTDAALTDTDIESPDPSKPTLKRFRVTVVEWLSHGAVIEAVDADDAEAQARELWEEGNAAETFHFCDAGIEEVVVDEA